MRVFYDRPSPHHEIGEDLMATCDERLMERIGGLLVCNAEPYGVQNCPQSRRFADQRQF